MSQISFLIVGENVDSYSEQVILFVQQGTLRNTEGLIESYEHRTPVSTEISHGEYLSPCET